jgi:hypothetical protein
MKIEIEYPDDLNIIIAPNEMKKALEDMIMEHYENNIEQIALWRKVKEMRAEFEREWKECNPGLDINSVY